MMDVQSSRQTAWLFCKICEKDHLFDHNYVLSKNFYELIEIKSRIRCHKIIHKSG